MYRDRYTNICRNDTRALLYSMVAYIILQLGFGRGTVADLQR